MENNYEEFFYSEDPQEIEKEKNKRSILHSLLPNLMGGKEDKTNYVLRDYGTGNNKSNDNITHTPNASAKTKGAFLLENNQKEFNFETDFIGDYIENSKLSLPRTVSVATGVASYEHILSLTKKAERLVDGLKINVYCIKNNFFGEQITVSGLLTGVDMAEQLSGKELGDELLIPSNTLRAEGDLFLCGMTPDELSSRLGVPVTPSKNDGSEFLLALLGIESDI